MSQWLLLLVVWWQLKRTCVGPRCSHGACQAGMLHALRAAAIKTVATAEDPAVSLQCRLLPGQVHQAFNL